MSIILRDSRHAAHLFGFTGTRLNTGTPRHKFQYFVNFRFNGAVGGFVSQFLGRRDQDRVAALVKTVQMPGLNVQTDVMNQYNHRRIVQTKIEPQSVSMSFHDTVDGRTLNLWEMYYEYYFKDGVAARKLGGAGVNISRFAHDTVKPRFEDDFGYNMERVGNNRQLINVIEIFQVQGGKFTQTSLVNPTITNFTHDMLDYSDREGLMEFRLDIMPEAIVYNNVNQSLRSLGSELLDRYRRGDFWEMSDILATTSDFVPGRVLNDPAPVPPRGAAMPQTSGNVQQSRRNTNVSSVQSELGALSDSIPGAFSPLNSTSVLNGKLQSDTQLTRSVATTRSGPARTVSSNPSSTSFNRGANFTGVFNSGDDS